MATLEAQKHETVTQNIKLMRIMIDRDEEVEKLKALLQKAKLESGPASCGDLLPDTALREEGIPFSLEGRQQRTLSTSEVHCTTSPPPPLLQTWFLHSCL